MAKISINYLIQIKNDPIITERTNYQDQEASVFNKAVDAVDDTQFTTEMISFLNQ